MSELGDATMKRILWLVLSLMPLVSAHATSFDCTKAATTVEKIICTDAEISKLDEELNATYKAALKNAKQAAPVRQSQKQWIKERNACADAACVKQKYVTRLQDYEADSNPDENCYACPSSVEAYLKQNQIDIQAKLSKEDAGLFDAIEKGDKAAVAKWLAKGANANAQQEEAAEYIGGGHFMEGETFIPLHVAAKGKNKEIVELLLAKGAQVNAKGAGRNTPLHEAVFYGAKEIVELLIAKGADINARTVDGLTPLHFAARGRKYEMAELLIAKGADVNARDTQGNTPLTEATRNKQKNIVELLIAKGAKVDAKDK